MEFGVVMFFAAIILALVAIIAPWFMTRYGEWVAVCAAGFATGAFFAYDAGVSDEYNIRLDALFLVGLLGLAWLFALGHVVYALFRRTAD